MYVTSMDAGNSPGSDECFSCEQNSRITSLAPRERILVGEGWRVAHAFSTALPGWLVLVARRHITTISELEAAEAAELGQLSHRMSRALTEVTGCVKTYVAAFSEAPGFTHLHVHVIPRARDLPAEEHGPAIFTYLRRPRNEWVSAAAMDDISAALSTYLLADRSGDGPQS